MALRSGNGGSVKVDGGSAIATDRWNGNWRIRDAEVTQSDSGGGTLYMAVVEDNEWEWTAARDDVNYPEALGMAPGNIVSMRFKLGAGSLCDRLDSTLITEVSPVVDNKGDVVRVTVRGKGGLLTPNTSY